MAKSAFPLVPPSRLRAFARDSDPKSYAPTEGQSPSSNRVNDVQISSCPAPVPLRVRPFRFPLRPCPPTLTHSPKATKHLRQSIKNHVNHVNHVKIGLPPCSPSRLRGFARDSGPNLTHSPKPLPHVGSRDGGQWTVNRALVCGLRKSEPARPPAPHRDWAVAAGEILGFAMGGGAG